MVESSPAYRRAMLLSIDLAKISASGVQGKERPFRLTRAHLIAGMGHKPRRSRAAEMSNLIQPRNPQLLLERPTSPIYGV